MPDVIYGAPFVFYGEVFNAYLADDRHWYLPLPDICKALGLDTNGQRQRIQRDEALQDHYMSISIDTPYRDTTRKRAVGCLSIKRLPYWLGTIDADRVREEQRERVILFKREFAEAAYQVFRSDFLPEDMIAEMDAYESPEQRQINEIMDEAAHLRRRIAEINESLNDAVFSIGESMGDFSGRLGKLEARFEGVEFINSDQQRNIQKMVAAIVMARTELEKSKAKGKIFFETWNGFKERFRVPLYQMLPAADYELAVEYLKGRWRHYFPDRDFPASFIRAGQKRML